MAERMRDRQNGLYWHVLQNPALELDQRCQVRMLPAIAGIRTLSVIQCRLF